MIFGQKNLCAVSGKAPSHSRSALLLLLGSLLLAPALVTSTQTAQAAIVERVVAVVGQDAIMLTELKQRALPYVLRVFASVPEGPARAANLSQLYRMVLDTMIDDGLELEAARKAGVEISDAQVDNAIEQTAAQNGISANEIMVEAKRSGLSVESYRDEMRRQLVQRSMMELRLRGRINVTESDLRATYRQLALDERMQKSQRTQALFINMGQSKEENAASQKLAILVASRAKKGEDFRSLIENYSTSGNSGLRPAAPPAQEPKEIQRATMALEVGESSDPVPFRGNWLILQVIERAPSEIPSYTEARDQIHERVYMEKIGLARKHWLEGLRRRSNVEIRL